MCAMEVKDTGVWRMTLGEDEFNGSGPYLETDIILRRQT